MDIPCQFYNNPNTDCNESPYANTKGVLSSKTYNSLEVELLGQTIHIVTFIDFAKLFSKAF